MKKSDPPIIVEQTYKTTIDTVWKAITELDQMVKWYFDNIPAFKPEVGFKTGFNIENEGRNFYHRWQVLEIIPNKKIKYNWKFDGYPGDSNVEFDLFDEGDSVKLRLTTTILDDFPEDIPEFRRESCIGGWEYFIQNRLADYLKQNE